MKYYVKHKEDNRLIHELFKSYKEALELYKKYRNENKETYIYEECVEK